MTNALEYDILEWDATQNYIGDVPGCLLGIQETSGYDDKYQLIMKMDDDCDDRRVEFEIYTYTLASEVPSAEQWYFHQNGDGTFDKDSEKTLQECWLDEEDEYYQICYYKIGYFENYIDLGLANPW